VNTKTKIIIGAVVFLGIAGALANGADEPEGTHAAAASRTPTATASQIPESQQTSEAVPTSEPAPEPTPEPTTEPEPTEAAPTSEPAPEPDPEPVLTRSQQNATRKAGDYLDFTAFSRTGLIEQLEYEGFSTEDATFGVDALNVNWNEQAAKKAEDYLDLTAFSRSGLVDQLLYEGFTREQAEYGVSQTGL
jgi:outer membrane biosynthesis protein TonB